MSKMIVEESPTRQRDGCWELVVRCVTDVEKGARLLTATPYSVTFSDDRASCTEVEGAPFAIDLLIDRIESYGKEWDLLNAGMTAKIFVLGDASAIPARTYLAGSFRVSQFSYGFT